MTFNKLLMSTEFFTLYKINKYNHKTYPFVVISNNWGTKSHMCACPWSICCSRTCHLLFRPTMQVNYLSKIEMGYEFKHLPPKRKTSLIWNMLVNLEHRAFSVAINGKIADD